MEKSNTIKELAGALAKAQAEMRAVPMTATNPFLKNRYADLGSVIETSKPTLAKHGLSVAQPVTGGADYVGVTTILMHESGEWISETVTLSLGDERGKSQAQVAGSIVTYLRRYSLAAMLGLYADEDADGNESKPAAPAQRKPEPAPEHGNGQVVPAERPNQKLINRWSELYEQAQAIGLTVESIDPAKITADELTAKGKALAARIAAVEKEIA